MGLPTTGRFLSDAEWAIATDVFGDTLPSRWRIVITDGTGAGNSPFTIPTSALSLTTIPCALQAALSSVAIQVLGGRDGWVAQQMNRTGFTCTGGLLSSITSMVNLGFIVSIGPAAYPDMSRDVSDLLVHEMTHVRQGKNSLSATTFVNNSLMHQCRASLFGASRNGAYDFPPGQRWSTYNVKQQAAIVEKWFTEGRRTDHALYPYIRDFVRKGKT